MRYIDCFNGDADGICALTQLHLHQPREAELVTGVKRNIDLLRDVRADEDDFITVLDISLDKNRDALMRVLQNGAGVFYCDHHFAGDIPEHENLRTLINTTPDVCTSLLINQHLDGAYLEWAIVGTFGDNMKRSATGLAKSLSITDRQLEQLEWLGIYLNYNGYGPALEDLYFHPANLFRRTVQHASPFEFMRVDKDTFGTLESGYHEDMRKAGEIKPDFDNGKVAVFRLPGEAWARRVSGVFGNDLANQFPARAHAVLSERKDGDLVVSVRAPLDNKQGADEVCRQFASGGGRAAAAGINQLPASDVSLLINKMVDFYV
jgi:hypothetical protein